MPFLLHPTTTNERSGRRVGARLFTSTHPSTTFTNLNAYSMCSSHSSTTSFNDQLIYPVYPARSHDSFITRYPQSLRLYNLTIDLPTPTHPRIIYLFFYNFVSFSNCVPLYWNCYAFPWILSKLPTYLLAYPVRSLLSSGVMFAFN